MQNPLVKTITVLSILFCYHISWLYSTPLFNVSLTKRPAPNLYSVTQCGKLSPTESHIPRCSPVYSRYVIVVECTNARDLNFAPQYLHYINIIFLTWLRVKFSQPFLVNLALPNSYLVEVLTIRASRGAGVEPAIT